MILPNYKNGSIVNLMSSIARACGGKTRYKPLKILPSKKIKSKNIILIVLDGIGYEYIKEHGKGSVLHKHLKGRITSVFPSTTASAITTFATGSAPAQHACTGWYMHLKELGATTAILPFTPRIGGFPFSFFGVRVGEVIGSKGFPGKIKTESYVVIRKEIAHSDFTKEISKKSEILSYNNLNGFFRQIKKAMKSSKRKYIYAYWPEFDSLSHDFGTKSAKTRKHFKEINKRLKKFIDGIKTDASIIITSDHGLIDTAKKRFIKLKDHPKLKECLTLPLCGEPRTAYCYVKPSKKKQFEEYAKKKLKRYCTLHKSENLIKKGYFGLFKPDSRLYDRVGDYILIMKENYILKDNLLGQKRQFHIGNHGGVSKEEMLVPLVFVRKKPK